MEAKKKRMVKCSTALGIIVSSVGIGSWYSANQRKQNQIQLLPFDNEIYTMELGSGMPSDADVFIDTENTSVKMQNTVKDIHLNYTEDQLVTNEDGITYLKKGDYEGIITAGSQELPFTLHIVDTTAPEATLSQESISFEYGTDLTDHDWNQYISTSDLDETSITVEQTIDTNTAGSYTVKYLIADPSGNSVEKELAVTVNEKPAPTTTTSSGSGSSTSRRNTSSGSSNSSTNSGSSSSVSSGSTGSGSSSSGSSSSGSSSSSSGGLTPGQSWQIDGWTYEGSNQGGNFYSGGIYYY